MSASKAVELDAKRSFWERSERKTLSSVTGATKDCSAANGYFLEFNANAAFKLARFEHANLELGLGEGRAIRVRKISLGGNLLAEPITSEKGKTTERNGQNFGKLVVGKFSEGGHKVEEGGTKCKSAFRISGIVVVYG